MIGYRPLLVAKIYPVISCDEFVVSQSARQKKRQQASMIVPTSVPRNPLVAVALLRKAGKHEQSRSTERRKAARAARVEADVSLKKP